MLAATPQGFKNARATQSAVLAVLMASVLVAILSSQPYFYLQWSPQLTSWHQWQRVLMNPLVWTSQSAAAIGSILLYECRGIERAYGTRKLVSVVALVMAVSIAVLPVVLAILSAIGVEVMVPAGPQVLVGTMVSLYHSITPPVYYVKVSGVGNFSDKLFVYLLLLSTCTTFGGVLKVGLGWLLAKLVVADVLAVKV